MTMAQSFAPDWCSPPGDTIKDALACHGLSSAGLGATLGLSTSSIVLLLSGDLAIDAGLADGLAGALGGSRQFWLRREACYRHRLEAAASTAAIDFGTFKEALPLKDMRSFGWLRDVGGGHRG